MKTTTTIITTTTTTTKVIAYVMKEEGMSLKEALSLVKSKRSCIQPNPGFMKQLETYEGILDARSVSDVGVRRRRPGATRQTA